MYRRNSYNASRVYTYMMYGATFALMPARLDRDSNAPPCMPFNGTCEESFCVYTASDFTCVCRTSNERSNFLYTIYCFHKIYIHIPSIQLHNACERASETEIKKITLTPQKNWCRLVSHDKTEYNGARQLHIYMTLSLARVRAQHSKYSNSQV